MTRAQAILIEEFGGADVLTTTSVHIPAPRPHEVLLRVLAVAVNHLDIEIRAGISRLPISLPHVPGRETIGEIVAVGSKVDGWSAGDRALVLPHVPCGRCTNCLRGSANICEAGWMPGIHAWGGYAEMMVAPAHGLRGIGSLDPVAAAALPISFGTAWRALHDTAQVRSGETVVVAGAAGGLGHACIQLAALAGARTIALVRSEGKADFVRQLGASEVIVANEADWAAQVRALTSGRGADIIIDHVGGAHLEMSLRCLADRGRLVVAGGHGGEHPSLDVVEVFRHEYRLLGVRSQRPDDVDSVLALAAAGVITPHIADVLPLSQARDAHRQIEARRIQGKVVLQPTDGNEQ